MNDMDSSKIDTFNLREFLEKYLNYWRWFVLSLIIAITCSFLYLRFSTPKYKVDATVLVYDKENEGGSSEISAFKDLGIEVNNNSKFGTEIGILRSRNLTEKVVSKLGLNHMYYRHGGIRDIELYGSSLPFKLNFFSKDSLLYYTDTLISIIPTSKTKFKLLDANDKVTGSHRFGENVKSKISDFTVTPTATSPIEVGLKIKFVLSSLSNVSNSYRNRLRIEQIDRETSLIMISLEDPVKQRAEEIVTMLINEYNLEGISDKILMAENTETFINDRIDGIFEELTVLESNTQEFKASNSLTDIDSESRLIMNTTSDLDQAALDLNTQLKLVGYMADFIKNKDNELIPTNLGLSNMSLNQSTISYNEILMERNRLLKDANSQNPIIINLENQLSNLKSSILQSLSNLESLLSISLADIRRQGYKLNSKITNIPKQERELKDIERQQQIVETLYLYLLQKREENALTLAVKSPNAKIIDTAYGSNNPVSPKPIFVYIIGITLGLLFPFMVLNVVFLLDNKVNTIEDIEAVLPVPVIGEIPKSKNFDEIVFENDDRIELIEALRIIRTDIDFVMAKNKKASKNIFITSTIEGEGKTSMSINLAKILALSSKKVLLIDGDLRRSSISKIFKLKEGKGLTNYLIDENLRPESIIINKSNNLDFLRSGTVPPNPSELLMDVRIDKIFEYANKNYDFVIIDTAPVSMVTDTVLLSNGRTDLLIYIVRANYLDKRLLNIPKRLIETRQLDNMGIILNSSIPKLAYGYNKNYGRTAEPWWKRVFA